MKLLNQYINGNYKVFIFDNGTKLRSTIDPSDTEFKPMFPENMDIKITNNCPIGCPYCHEHSVPGGDEADLYELSNSTFFKSLHPGTELAIGGGALSTLNKAALGNFMYKLALDYKLIPNITINAAELKDTEFATRVRAMMFLNVVYGIGISYSREYQDLLKDFLSSVTNKDRIVIHTIAGVTTKEDYEFLASLNCKILILGYKEFRRGISYFAKYNTKINSNIQWLSDNIKSLSKKFKTVSFDNLAVQQLDLKNKVSKEIWSKYYMGDDGNFTMYVDAVKHQFSPNSTYPESKRKSFNPYENTVEQLFIDIQKMKGN